MAAHDVVRIDAEAVVGDSASLTSRVDIERVLTVHFTSVVMSPSSTIAFFPGKKGGPS